MSGFDDGWYEPIRAGGVGAELINFFRRENAKQLEEGKYVPRTLHDFLDCCPERHRRQHENLGLEVRRFCHNLIAEGLIYPVGFDPKQELPYSERFVSYWFDDQLAAYGSYDFAAFGFAEVCRHFEPAVIRLGVMEDGAEHEQSGTAFL